MALLAACGGGSDDATGPVVDRRAVTARKSGMTDVADRATAPTIGLAPAPAAVVPTIGPTTTFDWVEWKFPALFPKGPQSFNLDYGGTAYVVRAYSTGNYIGQTVAGDIVGLGPFTGGVLTSFGNRSDWAVDVLTDLCTFRSGACSPPSIYSQPVSLTVDRGAAASFSVRALPESVSYQWRFNGVKIPGATGATLEFASVNDQQVGIYTVSVVGPGGGVTSAPASLALSPAPRIVDSTRYLNVDAGTSASLSVTASGAEPLQYQWRRDGLAIPGAVASTLDLKNASVNDAGYYTVLVSNRYGTTISAEARVAVAETIDGLPAIGYAELGQFDPSTIASVSPEMLPLRLDSISGAATVTAKIGSDGVLRFQGPTQGWYQDSTSYASLLDRTGLREWRVKLPWRMRGSKALNWLGDADEDGHATSDDQLDILGSGFPGNGMIGPSLTSMSFNIPGADGLDRESLVASLIMGSTAIDLAPYLTVGSSGQIYVQNAYFPYLLNHLRTATSAALVVSASTAGFEKTYGFEQALTYAGNTLNVTVLKSDGSADPALYGTYVAIRGLNTGYFASRWLDAQGKVTFPEIPTDSYEVEQVLLDPGTPFMAFPLVDGPDKVTSVTIVLDPTGRTTTSQVPAPPSALTSAERAAAPRPAPALLEPRRSPLAASPVYTLFAIAGGANELITRPVNYSIPKGTAAIRVQVSISSDEYPNYTSAQSQFNDLWHVDLQLPGQSLYRMTGKVNQTHGVTGALSYEKCLDVSSRTRDSALALSGQLSVQNVVDSSLPTTVSLVVTLGCDVLTASDFLGQSTTKDGSPVLTPRNSARNEKMPAGNIAGQYVSLPMAAALPSSFGIPATLTYSPANAAIDAVELQLQTALGTISLGSNYLAQASRPRPGVLRFESLRLNPTPFDLAWIPAGGLVKVMAVLKGTLPSLPGLTFFTIPAPLSIDGKYTDLTPLFLTSEMPGYRPQNRFSTHSESGGDSWATVAMSAWLFSAGVPYNDISAANVKQTATGRSVLGHSGHSDGQQVDLRYWDDKGGYSEPLNGVGQGKDILSLADAARAEVTANAATKPKLASLVDWITRNRSGLSGYALKPEVRRIYIGNQHISQLLIKGVFPGTTTVIPGAGAWPGRSAKILPQDKHLDHWHASTWRP